MTNNDKKDGGFLMYKTKKFDTANKMYINITELQAMTSLGRTTATKLGKAAGAERRIGKRLLYSVERIKSYIEALGDASPDSNDKETIHES